MLCLKKLHSDELLQIALLISILRVNQDALFETDIYGGVNDSNFDNGTSFSRLTPSVIRSNFIHPKSLDTVLLNYERDLFADLNSLGRFNNYRHQNISAYLLNIDRNSAPLAEPETLAVPPAHNVSNQPQEVLPRIVENEVAANVVEDGLELTQEDMDLIEVLWKQDVDLGFSLEDAGVPTQKLETVADVPDKKVDFEEFVKKNEEIQTTTEGPAVKIEPKDEKKEEEDDLWAGVNYTIDTETGEYVIKGENTEPVSDATDLEDLSLPLPEFLLDEALSLVELDEEQTLQNSSTDLKPVGYLSTGEEDDFDRDFDLFSEMIQAPQFHHPHHRAAFHQGRMPSFVRTVSMEQRWQDLANLLSLPPSAAGEASGMPHPFGPHHAHLHNYSHHPGHHAHAAAAAAAAAAAYGVPDARGVLLHNATLPTPMGDLNAGHYGNHLGGPTIGNAVATSMNLTNSSEPMGEPNPAPHYKMEPSSDIMPYYPSNFSEVASNQTDGFLSSILNDEDLQLMDMAMNEGMYTMRMLDANQSSSLNMNSTTASTSKNDMERLDTSSDSAVSSMGSERVPSLSDGEWCDAGSDSGHTPHGEHFYNYANRQLPETGRMPLVAQKKHQMYGKRYFQDQGNPSTSMHPHPTPIKYEYRDGSMPSYRGGPSQVEAISSKSQDVKYFCGADFSHGPRSSLDHIQHNHSYHLPAENSGPMQRPISRDKGKIRKPDEEHLTRDEKRAKAMNIPITVDDIINLPMDEFNERLSKYDLSETQLSLIRDIRRRGKNKVAAQNCRKRKLDQIMNLADEVREMRDRKLKLVNDHKYASTEVKRMKEKFQQLYRHVFQNLRDPEGNQYSPYQYSLQTAADGSMVMVPKDNNHPHSSKD